MFLQLHAIIMLMEELISSMNLIEGIAILCDVFFIVLTTMKNGYF